MSEKDSIPEYRPIPNFPGYRAGSDGSIWTCKERGGPRQWRLGSRWVRLKPTKSTVGYLRVSLSNRNNKKRFLYSVHRLILIAFVGPQPSPRHLARHLNSVRDDNRLSNLQWSTQSENLSDRHKAGTMIYGERCGKAKLNNEKVLEIRRLAKEGANLKTLNLQFGVSDVTIYHIVNRKTWTHI